MSTSSADNSQSLRSADSDRRVEIGKRLHRTRIEHVRESSSAHNNGDSVASQRISPWRVVELSNRKQIPRVDSLPTVLIEKVLERPTSCGAITSVGVTKVSLPDIQTSRSAAHGRSTDIRTSRSAAHGRSTGRPLSLCEKELLESVLRQSAACREFADDEIGQVASMCTSRKYKADDVVVKYGQQWPFMCCILSGSCQVTRGSGKKLGTISTRCWFGDLAHINALATVSCISDVTLVLITQQMLQLVSPPKPLADIEHLKKIGFLEHLLGEGASGTVLPCLLPSEGDKLHAVKCIQKHKIKTRKAKQQVVNEVKLLTQAQHPFIVQHTASLQDSQCIYLVMEHLPGGTTTPFPLASAHA